MRASSIDLPLPEHTVAVLRALRGAGGRAWVVGGAVRDFLIGMQPTDFDLATDLGPAAVQRALPGADATAAAYGAVTVAQPAGKVTITTLRSETGYADRRHPDAVSFVSDLGADAVRRDFTVNALYVDVDRGELLDPCEGRRDLEARRLTAIGDPAVRFAEDPLRLLRLARLAARCGLQPDAATAAAARALAGDLTALSAERIFDELNRAFIGPGRGRALTLLVDLGLAAVVLPEVAAMAGIAQPPEYHPEGDVLTHAALVLDHVPAGDPVLAWSAVLHDVGKPATFRLAHDRIRFDGHDVLSAELAAAVLQRLRAPRAMRDTVVDVCRQHIRFASLPAMRPRRRERWLRAPDFHYHLAFHRADCLGSHGKLDIYEFARRELDQLPPNAPPLLRGRDVLDLGVPPGPAVGRLLAAAEAALDEAPMAPTREQALILLREMVERWRQA